MSLSRLFSIRHTLAFRLTLWYAGIFSVSTCIAFIMFYLLITSVIRSRLDQDLIEQQGQLTTIMQLRGLEAVKQAAMLEARAAGVKKIFIRLLYPNGRIFSSSNMEYWQNIGVSRKAIESLMSAKEVYFETIRIPERGTTVRTLYARITPGIILQLGQSMEGYIRFIDAFNRIFTVTMGILILLAAGVGWFMARRAMSGVETVIQTARDISGNALDRRVPVKARTDEIDQLAITFNRMLDRIQTLVNDIREMNDNIAHDLKSPITRIRGIAEVTMTTADSADEYNQMAASIIEECDRLLDTINTVLFISKTDAGVDAPQMTDIDMAAVVQDACDLFQPLAEDKGIDLSHRSDTPLPLEADIRLIQRMLANLLDNAIKYTPPSGRVEVTAGSRSDSRVSISVRDSGSGIISTDLPHIFKRFYRGDHSRTTSGTGLGLSLSLAVAKAHGGDIIVESRPDEGSTFTVVLPRRQTPTSEPAPP